VTTAAQLLKGKWTARWANWSVGLEWKAGGWEVTVWRQLPGKKFRHALGSHDGLRTTEEAVSWACRVMRDDGAKVMVLDAPTLTLESALSFRPTLEVVLA